MTEPEDYIDESSRRAQELSAQHGRWETTAIMAVSAAGQAVDNVFRVYTTPEAVAKIEAVSRIAAALIMSERSC